MKRLITGLVLMVLGGMLYAQVGPTNKNVYGIAVKNKINAIATQSNSNLTAADSLRDGDFDVGAATDVVARAIDQDSFLTVSAISFGATPDVSDGNDAVGIRAAVAYVDAWTRGGKVIIPAGLYNIDDSIILRSNIWIDMHPKTYLRYDNTTDGCVFYSGGEILSHSRVSGGWIQGLGWNWSAFKLHYGATFYGVHNIIEDVYILGADTALDVRTTGSGWWNGNIISNTVFSHAKVQVSLNNGGIGVEGNTFSNIQFQSGDSVYTGIDFYNAGSNVFSPMMFWDYDLTGPAAQKIMRFRGSSSANTIVSGDLTWELDGGYDIDLNSHQQNIISNGVVFNQPKVAHVRIAFDDAADFVVGSVRGATMVTDVKVVVGEAFNDTGTNYLDIGTNFSAAWFANDVDVSSTGFQTVTPAQLPYTWVLASGGTIECTYTGSNANASAGYADVYVTYIPLLNIVESQY